MRNERGGGDSVAWLLVTPVVIGVVVLLIQYALWWRADQQVTAAAQAGAEEARTLRATPAAIESAARALEHDLNNFTVDHTRNADTVTVTVDAIAPQLIPIDTLTRVDATVTLSRERVEAP